MGAKILLPVRAHIKKYLEHTHGNQLAVSDHGYASFLLLNMLQKHEKQDASKVRPSQKLIDNINYFPYPVYVGSTYQNSKGLYLTTKNIKRFNESIDDLFREQMYYYVNHPNSVDHKIDYDILRFRDMHKITEDELPFENLKRWYFRERLRFTARINYTPPFTPQYTLTF